MNFNEIATEIITTRFNESMRGRVKRWVNQIEQKVWDAEDWPFKYVTDQALTVTSGTQTIDTSGISDFNRPVTILDADGVMLKYLTPREWDMLYGDDLSVGEPLHYTLVNRRVYLGPTPQTDATFTTRYERTLAHYDLNGVVTASVMVEDTDYPLWDPGYHFCLVPGTLSLGLKLVNDPTWEPLEMDFQDSLNRMRTHYMPPQYGNRSYAGPESWQT